MLRQPLCLRLLIWPRDRPICAQHMKRMIKNQTCIMRAEPRLPRTARYSAWGQVSVLQYEGNESKQSRMGILSHSAKRVLSGLSRTPIDPSRSLSLIALSPSLLVHRMTINSGWAFSNMRGSTDKSHRRSSHIRFTLHSFSVEHV